MGSVTVSTTGRQLDQTELILCFMSNPEQKLKEDLGGRNRHHLTLMGVASYSDVIFQCIRSRWS